MKRAEFLSRLFIMLGIVLAIGAPVAFWLRTPLIHVSMAEDGGWNPDTLKAEVGKPLDLKLISDDVMHGFAVGQMDMSPVDILPGKVTNVTLTFDKPGSYTFYCTRWCGLNHWRMRGTIEVAGPTSDAETASVPLYLTLGIDIDAKHEAPVIPSSLPSALRGQQLGKNLDLSAWTNADVYRSSSPYQVFESLKSTGLTDAEKWDVVAAVWQANTSPQSLEDGKNSSPKTVLPVTERMLPGTVFLQMSWQSRAKRRCRR